MNRSHYFNYIEEKLDFLFFRIEKRGKINLLDLNIYSETFFSDLLNKLFNWDLINLNTKKQNIEGIDLIDTHNKIIAQVSSTYTKQKIENSLSKEIFEDYPGFCFKFIPLSKNGEKLKQTSFDNPHKVIFTPADDIIDINDINKAVLNMSIDDLTKMFDFIKKELGDDVDIVKVDSNLATILNILASENLANKINSPEINPFTIDHKITYNDLLSIKPTIDDYKIYYHKLDEKYSEFDKLGVNKSKSVFQLLKRIYLEFLPTAKCSRELFYLIVNRVIELILSSKNYIELPYEELEMCAYIIVVDAFVRCIIFENPEGYNHVVTG